MGGWVLVREWGEVWRGGERWWLGREEGGVEFDEFAEDGDFGLFRRGEKGKAMELASSIKDSHSIFLDRKKNGVIRNHPLTSGTSSAFGFLRISHSTVTGVSGLRAIPARMLC